jgi:hypothetical protein
MKLPEAITKLKSLIQNFNDANPDPAPVKFMEAELKDGSKVKIEPALEKGAKVVLIDAEGKEVEAPNGEHTVVTPDGAMIIKVEGGLIIEDPKKEEAPAEATLPPADMSAELAKVNQTLSGLVTSFEELKKENVKLKKQIEDSKEIQSETFKVVEQLAAVPAVTPTDTDEKHSHVNKFEQLAKNLKSIKAKI